MADKPSYVEAYELAEKLMHEFVEKQIDHVELIYHHFKSMGAQVQMCIRDSFCIIVGDTEDFVFIQLNLLGISRKVIGAFIRAGE